MNSIKAGNVAKIVGLNLVVFGVMWTAVELVGYFKNPMNKESNRVTCTYDWVLYNYCPDIMDVKVNADGDGGAVVFTHTNGIGQRIRDRGAPANETAKHIFVGDSFVQADEMPYEETFYGILEDTFDVTAIGYSSWNIVQYRDAIEKLGVENAHYHVFLMPNDVSPTYHRSVYREKQDNPERVVDLSVPAGVAAELAKAWSNSLAVEAFQLAGNLIQPKKQGNVLQVLNTDKFGADHRYECAALADVPPEYQNAIGYDYLVYAKDPSCWSEVHSEAAAVASDEIGKLAATVSDLNSELTMYMIPAGWSFPNQNTTGRKNNRHYFFDDAMIVTTEPLTDFFATQHASIKFVSLEKLLAEDLQKCGACANEYYYAIDGHWTPTTHRFLADYFSNEVRN